MRGTANLGKLKGTLKSFCYSKVEYGIWRNGTEGQGGERRPWGRPSAVVVVVFVCGGHYDG